MQNTAISWCLLLFLARQPLLLELHNGTRWPIRLSNDSNTSEHVRWMFSNKFYSHMLSTTREICKIQPFLGVCCYFQLENRYFKSSTMAPDDQFCFVMTQIHHNMSAECSRTSCTVICCVQFEKYAKYSHFLVFVAIFSSKTVTCRPPQWPQMTNLAL